MQPRKAVITGRTGKNPDRERSIVTDRSLVCDLKIANPIVKPIAFRSNNLPKGVKTLTFRPSGAALLRLSAIFSI